MSEEEYMECSVVAYPRQIKFLHINGGAISYYVDRHVSDYVDRLQKENQELKEQLLVVQTNEETFRLEMEDITRALGLDEDTIFDDVKTYARSLKDNWNKLKEKVNEGMIIYRNKNYDLVFDIEEIPKEDLNDFISYLAFQVMEQLIINLEQGSDSNVYRF